MESLRKARYLPLIMGSTTSPPNTVQPAPVHVYTPSTPVAQILESIVNDGNARSASSNSPGSQRASGNNRTPRPEVFNALSPYPPAVAATITEPFSPPIAAPFFSFPIPAQNGASPIVRTPSFLHTSTGGSLRYTSLPYLPPDITRSPLVFDANTKPDMPIAHEATSRQTPPPGHAPPVLINDMHDVTPGHTYGRAHEHSTSEPVRQQETRTQGHEASFSPREHVSSSSHSLPHRKSSTSKFKSSKTTTNNGMHERIKEELRRARDNTTYSSRSQSHSHSHSRSRSEANSSATPTADDHEHHHRSRHHKHSSSSSTSLSAMLVLASERLARETKRADAAEREGREVLALFKTLHATKGKIEQDFLRVKEELGLYKIQLDIAQKEIYRAQEIVDRVDRQRANAEDEIQRLSSKLRRLQEERAVAQALDEGRRLGYEEGLRQGRVAMQQYERHDGSDGGEYYEGDRNSGVTRFTYPRDDVQSMDSSLRSTDRQRGRHRAQPPLANAPKPGLPAKRRRDPLPPAPERAAAPSRLPPDTAPFAPTLPVPTVTTPMPVPVPESQPPVPKPMPPHQPPEQIRVHPHPNDHNAPIHPVPWNNAPRSPSVSHRDMVLPPDNYIPVMGANSVISLPPPHELSAMVAPDALAPERSIRSGRGGADIPASANPIPPSRPPSAGGQRARPPSAFRVVNQDPSERPRRASRPPISFRQPRTDRDTGSTYQYQSELDALSPPRDYREYVPGSFYGRPDKSGNGNAGGSGKRPDSAEVLVEQWRSANPEYGSTNPTRSLTPGPKQPERPPTAGPPQSPYGKPASLTAGSAPPIRTPRQPRDIVLPMPDMPVHRPPSRNQQEAYYPSSPHHLATTPSTYGRPNLNTEISNVTVPGIDIQTPSTHASHSVRSDHTHMTLNPGYLTPESANRPVPLPRGETHAGDTSLGLTFSPASSTRSLGAERLRGGAGNESEYDDRENIEMTLPTNELPPGFVPLSPLNIGK